MSRPAWNPLYTLAGGSALVAGILLLLMPGSNRRTETPEKPQRLFVYCAAGLRTPVAQIAADYERDYNVAIELQYGGSNTLLSQIEASQIGDLYLAGDESYVELAQQKGLAREAIPLAKMRPAIVVAAGNPKKIERLEDLWRSDVSLALANPDQAAVGKLVRVQLEATRQWEQLNKAVQERGVYKPTVGEVANDVKLGSVDAGVVWDAVAAQYPGLETLDTSVFQKAQVDIEAAVLDSSQHPTAALRFARYLAARDRGQKTFARLGYRPADGDRWAVRPELTLFAGSVNRRVLAPIIEQFAAREGVEVNTVYNGCGILTAQMKTLQDGGAGEFPDAFMACDRYYMEVVSDLFPESSDVSNTRIVIVVNEGNPKQIRNLADLAKPGIRVALGQPEQCTIGVLSRRLLESVGLYDEMLEENVVTQTATSALLVPSVVSGGADAALVYETDTRAESERLDVVAIDSPLAQAIQPYGVAQASQYQQLSDRLLDTIGRHREQFEAAGFRWLYDPPTL